jgi:ubiquinol-cytochrome c reductase iron-sulfur subunit
MSVANDAPSPNHVLKRRDFLYVATATAAAMGGIAALVPLIDQMNPAADVLAAGGPITVDLSKVMLGQQVVFRWQEKPIFIVHRTPKMLHELTAPSLLARLRDPESQAFQQPAYADNWSRAINPNFLVVVGICTHLGCIPDFKPMPHDPSLGANWPGGYLCPCHGSRYDLAGRVFQGVPAPLNLPVPPYHFENASTMVLGANPKGSNYSLTSVLQL